MDLTIRVDADAIQAGSELTFQYTNRGGDNVFPMGADISGELVWETRPRSEVKIISPSLEGGVLVVESQRWNIEPRGSFQMKDHAGNEANTRTWVVVSAANDE